MDWMTLAITAVGGVIFCLWVIIPIREYRQIFARLRERNRRPDPPPPQRTGHDRT